MLWSMSIHVQGNKVQKISLITLSLTMSNLFYTFSHSRLHSWLILLALHRACSDYLHYTSCTSDFTKTKVLIEHNSVVGICFCLNIQEKIYFPSFGVSWACLLDWLHQILQSIYEGINKWEKGNFQNGKEHYSRDLQE